MSQENSQEVNGTGTSAAIRDCARKKEEEGRKKTDPNLPDSTSRRSFLNKAGGLTAAALAAGMVPLAPLLGGKETEAKAAVITDIPALRAAASLVYRLNTANSENFNVSIPQDNGDNARFSDHSALWSKALKHNSLQIVDPASWASFIRCFSSGKWTDFESMIMGNPGGTNFTATMNGPQACLAFDLEGLDSHATVIPPAPSVTTAQTAAEMVEHYWGALCRDVPFIDYPTNSLVAEACADLNNLSYPKSSGNFEFPYPFTPQNLFRGQIVPGDGSVQGPFVSQFMIQPTFLGAQPVSQRLQNFLPGQDFVTSVQEFLNVENGLMPSASLAFDPTLRYLRDGRSLAAYTHVDALHQAYFVACLVLLGINAPLNPGNPYTKSKTEHGFCTLGGPDALGTLPEMATRALKAAWFHKWLVNLRQRPEEFGGLVHARLANLTPTPQAATVLHPDVLNSQGVAQVFSKYGTYLLPLAFPEGAPAHPCYPTGHGTVGGACIAGLKFFFDGTQLIRPLLQAAGTDVMQPSEDGTTLVPYTGSDADSLTINGELSKLAWNVTTGHGIHAGIHYRSSSYYSIILGEQVGISVLKDRAKAYNEPFKITITKFDGTKATISNSGNVQV